MPVLSNRTQVECRCARNTGQTQLDEGAAHAPCRCSSQCPPGCMQYDATVQLAPALQYSCRYKCSSSNHDAPLQCLSFFANTQWLLVPPKKSEKKCSRRCRAMSNMRNHRRNLSPVFRLLSFPNHYANETPSRLQPIFPSQRRHGFRSAKPCPKNSLLHKSVQNHPSKPAHFISK